MRVPSAVMPHFQNGRAFSDSSTVICRPFACTRSLDSGYITVSSFRQFSIPEPVYGTPVYITTEEQVSKYKKAFTDCAHNKGKVSSCLLMERDVVDGDCDGNKVIVFVIPRASYDMRPVYINGNPNNTYRRDHEGDYICTQSEISRMYADADILTHPVDGRILKNYSLASDFDDTTIRQYRQLFALRHEGHPWNDLDDMEFLKRIEGYKVDRETGEEGFTLAALLMFGNELAIRDAVPHYFVDYREKLSNDPRIRYTDRVYPDGTWVPNIFQFYSRVYPKLSQALPTPFKLVGDVR